VAEDRTDKTAAKHIENECGCVVVPSTGQYLALCRAHRWLAEHPDWKHYAEDAEQEGRRG
jgi:hypothetical protein